jgi:curved DNA-binding protein CbpA
MTDCFALLQQPRQPWLDPDELRERYHQLTLTAHPDQDRASLDFAAVTEAYRVLTDPKLRLQHLLKLQGHDAPADSSVPLDLLDLFSRIGNFFQATDGLLQKSQATQNALARSLIQPEILAARREVEEILGQVRALHDDAIAQTHALHESWTEALPAIASLSRRFAYLGRWMEQLQERQFQLG